MRSIQPITLETGVPMQWHYSKGGRARYPFAQMAVGDSFALEGTEADRERVRAAAAKHSARHNVTIVVRQQESGFRVWRTA